MVIDPLGTSLREGLPFTLHSDLPVTPVDPLASIHNAVNRVTRDGKLLGPEERIPVYDAFNAYATQAAFCSFEETIKGSIADGYLADFTVLSDNPFSIDPQKLKEVKILGTFVGERKFTNTVEEQTICSAQPVFCSEPNTDGSKPEEIRVTLFERGSLPP